MRKLLVTLAIGLTAQAVHAAPYTVVGTLPTVIHTTEPVNRSLDSHEYSTQKIVQLMKVELSEEAKQELINKVNALENAPSRSANLTAATDLPPSLDIGMNNVPVLDQGAHGTCVTFAVAGALDAILQRGAYVSELCSLELGSYLSNNNSSYMSGWDGSDAPVVFNQFKTYGIISRDKQATGVCAGVKVYNLYSEEDQGKPFSSADYRLNSEAFPEGVKLDTIVDVSNHLMTASTAEKALTKIKTSLNEGHRVFIGTLLDVRVDGRDGAVGKLNANNDTWMMTPAIAADVKKKVINAAHEMVIVGYDDNAVVQGPKKDASDPNSERLSETGVLILRNSWGARAGDHGTYYMTYNHFKALGLDVEGIVQ